MNLGDTVPPTIPLYTHVGHFSEPFPYVSSVCQELWLHTYSLIPYGKPHLYLRSRRITESEDTEAPCVDRLAPGYPAGQDEGGLKASQTSYVRPPV